MGMRGTINNCKAYKKNLKKFFLDNLINTQIQETTTDSKLTKVLA